MSILPLAWIEEFRVQPPGFEPVTAELSQSIVQRIVEGVKPDKIILFCSYAFGNPTPDSDLDIFVIMDSEQRPSERVLAISRLLRPRPFPMDILVRTPAEVAHSLDQKDPFIQEIISQGKILYEQRARSN